jgi:hypothetical protein
MKSFCRRAWAQPIFRLTILALFAGLVAVFNLVTRWPVHHIASAYAVWVQWACIGAQWVFIFRQYRERKAFKCDVANCDFWLAQMDAAATDYHAAGSNFDTPAMTLAEARFELAKHRLISEHERIKTLYKIK